MYSAMSEEETLYWGFSNPDFSSGENKTSRVSGFSPLCQSPISLNISYRIFYMKEQRRQKKIDYR